MKRKTRIRVAIGWTALTVIAGIGGLSLSRAAAHVPELTAGCGAGDTPYSGAPSPFYAASLSQYAGTTNTVTITIDGVSLGTTTFSDQFAKGGEIDNAYVPHTVVMVVVSEDGIGGGTYTASTTACRETPPSTTTPTPPTTTDDTSTTTIPATVPTTSDAPPASSTSGPATTSTSLGGCVGMCGPADSITPIATPDVAPAVVAQDVAAVPTTTSAVAPVTGALPVTGSDTGVTLALAAAVLLVGVGLVTMTRRRRA